MRHGRKTVALILIAFLAVAPALAEGPKWFRSLDQAKAAAGRSRKPILCIVAKGTDRRADKLVRDLEKNRKLSDLLPPFVAVRLDRTRNQALVKKYDLKYSPSTIFFTSRGVPIKVVAGAVSSAKYAAQMKAVLEKYRKILDPSIGAPTIPGRHDPPSRPRTALPHSQTCPEACPTCTATIEKALAFLAKKQTGGGKFTKPASERETRKDVKTLTRSIDRIDTALTALAGMAFLAEMEKLAPDPGRLARLQRTADYLSGIQDPRSGAWGYSYDFREFSPNDKRGWRLLATSHCCLTALNHMRRAGAEMDPEVFERGARYLLACRSRDGSFAYRSEFRRGGGYPGARVTLRARTLSKADRGLSRRPAGRGNRWAHRPGSGQGDWQAGPSGRVRA